MKTTDGAVVASLATPPLSGARSRLQRLVPRTTAEAADVVRSLLFAAQPGVAGAAAGQPAPRAAADLSGDFLDIAHRIGGELARRTGESAGEVWALARFPLNGAFALDRLQDDILSGSAGLSLVLDWLARRTGDALLARAADHHLRRTEAALTRDLRALEQWQRPGVRSPLPGLHSGLGGLLLAVARAGGRSTPELVSRAVGVLETTPLPPTWGGDVGFGAEGLVAVLNTIPGPSPELLERLRTHMPAGRVPDALRWNVAEANEREPLTGCLADAPSLSLLLEIERRLLSDPSPASSAAECAQLLMRRRIRDGRWFGERLAPDRYRIPALWGTAAVAYALSRIDDPAGAPSLWFGGPRSRAACSGERAAKP